MMAIFVIFGGFLIWLLEIIILTVVLTPKKSLSIMKKVVVFLGTVVVSPGVFLLLSWLVIEIATLFNLIDHPTFSEGPLAGILFLLTGILFLGVPLMIMKLIIKILEPEKGTSQEKVETI